MSPSDRRAQMHSLIAGAVEVGRRLSASPPPGLRRHTGTPAQRRRLLAVTGGVIGAVLAASVALHSWGAPDPPVRAPYVPASTTAVSTADSGAYPDPAGLSGVPLPRIAIATPPPLPPAPPPPPPLARLVPAGPGPSHARPPVHRVVGPLPVAPPLLPPPPPEVVAAPLLTPPPAPSQAPPPPPPTAAPSPSATPR